MHWLKAIATWIFYGYAPQPFSSLVEEPASFSAVELKRLRQELLLDHNYNRYHYNLATLLPCSALDQAAQFKAERMAETGNVEHDDLNNMFEDRLAAVDYAYATAGENLALGQLTVQEVMTRWLHDRDNAQNVFSPTFREVGFGVAVGGGAVYWCAVYGTPRIVVDQYNEYAMILPEAVVG